MFASLNRMVGNVTVKEQNGVIHASGLPANLIDADIRRVWATNRIVSNMFINLGRSEFTIPSFFAIDLDYILRKLYDSPGISTNRRALRKLIAELHQNTWLANIQKFHPPYLDFNALHELNVPLLEHQQRGLERYNFVKPRYGLNGLLLNVAPGGGKTIFDLAIAVAAHAEKVYIICPKNSIHSVWAKTIEERFCKPQQVWIAADETKENPQARFFICHYEALERALAMSHSTSGKRTVVILDESHNFNTHDSKRTMLYLQLVKSTHAVDVIWASGTPIKAMGAEAIPLIRSIDPLFTADAEMRFRKIFGADARKAYDILNHRMGILSYKVEKSEFMASKPVMRNVDVKIPNGAQYTLPHLKDVMQAFIKERTAYYHQNRKAFHSFYEDCVGTYEKTVRTSEDRDDLRLYRRHVKTMQAGWDARTMAPIAKYCNDFERTKIMPALPQQLRAQFRDTKSVVKYVELKIRGECLGRVLSKQRELCHVDMVKYVDFGKYIDGAEKKTLIFTSYVEVVKAVGQQCTSLGYKPTLVYADTNADIAGIVDRFTNDEDINPMGATYQSLSTAVPITIANTLLMLNSPFRHHDQEQAISRCNRLGQDATVYVFRFFLDTGEIPNISTRSEEIFNWSKEQVDAILGIEGSGNLELGIEEFTEAEMPIDCWDELVDLTGGFEDIVAKPVDRMSLW